MKNTKTLNESGAQCSAAAQLIHGCKHCVNQCDELLNMVSQQVYGSFPEGTSSIGAHMRHILDRYLCFFAGLQNGLIDYDARKRDKSIETNLEAAAFALTSVSRRIDAMTLSEELGKTITVRESVYHQGPSVEIPSTVDRELMGLISHSIHHLAIIALITKSFGYRLDSDFGKAPSTILYERS